MALLSFICQSSVGFVEKAVAIGLLIGLLPPLPLSGDARVGLLRCARAGLLRSDAVGVMPSYGESTCELGGDTWLGDCMSGGCSCSRESFGTIIGDI